MPNLGGALEPVHLLLACPSVVLVWESPNWITADWITRDNFFRNPEALAQECPNSRGIKKMLFQI